jgi:hypothetical protein
MTSRVKFADGPPGSTSWAYITADGDLVVECYDHGEEAEATFGHDVAFLLHLDPLAQQHLADTLANDRSRAGDPQDLPERLALHFGSYFEVRNWLDKHRIAYRHEFDSWA